MNRLTIEDIRAIKTQLCSRAVSPSNLPEGWDWEVTVGGVVFGPRGSLLHHLTFKDLVGDEEYNHVMAKPKVVCSYDLEKDNE